MPWILLTVSMSYPCWPKTCLNPTAWKVQSSNGGCSHPHSALMNYRRMTFLPTPSRMITISQEGFISKSRFPQREAKEEEQRVLAVHSSELVFQRSSRKAYLTILYTGMARPPLTRKAARVRVLNTWYMRMHVGRTWRDPCSPWLIYWMFTAIRRHPPFPHIQQPGYSLTFQ